MSLGIGKAIFVNLYIDKIFNTIVLTGAIKDSNDLGKGKVQDNNINMYLY